MDEVAWPTSSGLTVDAHRERGKEDRHTVHAINRDSHRCTEQGLAGTGFSYLSPGMVPLGFNEHVHDEAVVTPGSHSQGSLPLLD